jgi:hypothetical protein
MLTRMQAICKSKLCWRVPQQEMAGLARWLVTHTAGHGRSKRDRFSRLGVVILGILGLWGQATWIGENASVLGYFLNFSVSSVLGRRQQISAHQLCSESPVLQFTTGALLTLRADNKKAWPAEIFASSKAGHTLITMCHRAQLGRTQGLITTMRLLFLLALLPNVHYAFAATPAEWQSRSIYQVVTDRFARTDGSTTAPCDPGLGEYCGGTFQRGTSWRARLRANVYRFVEGAD